MPAWTYWRVIRELKESTLVAIVKGNSLKIFSCKNKKKIQGFHPLFHESDLVPLFHPFSALFFERNHSFGVKMVSENVWKTFKSCPWSWNPTGKKQIYTTGKRSYTTGHICKIFHFALSLLNWEMAITPERTARLTWFFGSMPKIEIYDHLIF